MATRFGALAQRLKAAEATIVQELNDVQGQAMDVGGYYMPNDALAAQAMRPSQTLNGIIDAF